MRFALSLRRRVPLSLPRTAIWAQQFRPGSLLHGIIDRSCLSVLLLLLLLLLLLVGWFVFVMFVVLCGLLRQLHQLTLSVTCRQLNEDHAKYNFDLVIHNGDLAYASTAYVPSSRFSFL